jgi:hypothetical protein
MLAWLVCLLSLKVVNLGEEPRREQLEAANGLRMSAQFTDRHDRAVKTSTTGKHEHCELVNFGIAMGKHI